MNGEQIENLHQKHYLPIEKREKTQEYKWFSVSESISFDSFVLFDVISLDSNHQNANKTFGERLRKCEKALCQFISKCKNIIHLAQLTRQGFFCFSAIELKGK